MLDNKEDLSKEHQLHYDIYYNELALFYQKNTYFSTIQLALLSGLILKFNELKQFPAAMIIGLIFLVLFTIVQLLVSIRGNHVNNAVIGVITEFENKNGFSFLESFSAELKKGHRIKQMNFPSFAIIMTNILFLSVWFGLLLYFLFITIPQGFLGTIHNQVVTFFLSIKIQRMFIISVCSCLFAVTMKIADMHDEHGMYLFKRADIVFGFLWGLFGAILVLLDVAIANALFAMMMGYVLRKRLDYPNHLLAFSIVISVFLFGGFLDKKLFFPFWIAFTLLGKLKDMKYLNKPGRLATIIKNLYLYIPIIYALPTFVYGLFSGDWYVFISMFLFDLTYNITRIIAKRKSWYKDEQMTLNM